MSKRVCPRAGAFATAVLTWLVLAAQAVPAPGQTVLASGPHDHESGPPPADAKDAAVGAAAVQHDDEDDTEIDRAQLDFTVVNLPTTLRLPKFRSAFRVTHRFSRPLGQGDFGDLVDDFFGLDGGALIGLEYRFGVWRGAQAGIYRTSNRTIQFFGQYGLLRQDDVRPVGLDVVATVEGANNFREQYAPALGAILSRRIADRASLYAQPLWVANTNPLPSDLADDNGTLMLGLGARVNVAGAWYGVVEFSPRLAGYRPGAHHVAFGIEGGVGGHAFQVNFSNGTGSTLGQMARGAFEDADGDPNWHLGFNISRKFW